MTSQNVHPLTPAELALSLHHRTPCPIKRSPLDQQLSLLRHPTLSLPRPPTLNSRPTLTYHPWPTLFLPYIPLSLSSHITATNSSFPACPGARHRRRPSRLLHRLRPRQRGHTCRPPRHVQVSQVCVSHTLFLYAPTHPSTLSPTRAQISLTLVSFPHLSHPHPHTTSY